MKNMAKLIKNKRLALKMTISETAKLAECTVVQSLSNWERMTQPIPLNRLNQLAKALKITKKDIKEAYLLDMEIKFNKGTK